MSALLKVSELSVRHGGLTALDEVSVEVHRNQIVGLIGPNGAGKTTFIDALSGFVATAGGHIDLDGARIDDLVAHQRARRGLVRTFQSLELFDDLTVAENLLVAAGTPSLWSTITDVFMRKSTSNGRCEEVLELLRLTEHAAVHPNALSNGQRHLVALGRALIARPTVLLLDEPAAGLDPAETAELARCLGEIRERGTAVLLIDHDMSLVFGICDEVHVLDFGRIIASGTPAEVRSNPIVLEAYLGRSEHAR